MGLEETDEGVILRVKVTPKASKSEVVGWEGDELKVRVAAVPDKGKANEALLKFFSKFCKVPKKDLSLLSGETSRHKRVMIVGKTSQELKVLLPEVVE